MSYHILQNNVIIESYDSIKDAKFIYDSYVIENKLKKLNNVYQIIELKIPKPTAVLERVV